MSQLRCQRPAKTHGFKVIISLLEEGREEKVQAQQPAFSALNTQSFTLTFVIY